MPNRGVRVESMPGGGWIVKGTTDVEVARRLLKDRHVYDKLTVSDARWFRIVPMEPRDPCGLGHTHHLVPDPEKKQGAFPAVIFSAKRDAPVSGIARPPRPSSRATRQRWA